MSLKNPPRLAIFGSCVSRDPFVPHPDQVRQIKFYLARQSFVGLGNPGVRFDPAWYDETNSFEKRCVFADLSKDNSIWAFEDGVDFLVIDYIDERFDLLRIDRSYVSATGRIQQPGFLECHGRTMQKVPRLSAVTTALWAQGAERFFTRALKTVPAERIILHEARWANNFRAPDGSLIPFGPRHRDLIAPHNALLDEYYRITKSLVPGIRSWRPADNVLFADPNHRWSKEPFHYIESYSHAFIQGFEHLVQSAMETAA